MLNARECRRQAAVCRAEARVTESIGASTTLMAMARSWAMLAHQMDRLQAHPRPEISLFNCTESVPGAAAHVMSVVPVIFDDISWGIVRPTPGACAASRAETSFCRSPVVRLLLIIQVPDASDKRGVGLLLRPINRFSLRFEGAERMVRVVLHKARLDKTGQGTGTRTRRHAPYIASPLPESESVAQQVRRLGNVGGNAPGSAPRWPVLP